MVKDSPWSTPATVIMKAFHDAEDLLLGATAARFNGETGTVAALKLDPDHGLCFAFSSDRASYRANQARVYWPVSTIKFIGVKDAGSDSAP